MLPIQLDELTEGFFAQICTDQWPETQTLEFKAVLPGTEDPARQEFRKDVCALANADGGDILYGISERNAKANAILAIQGVEIDATKRRLRQILDAQVEPKIYGIQMHGCTIAQGGFVLCIRVPKSFDGPHRIGTANAHQFPIRNETTTAEMTYDQLREAFGRGALLLEKASAFHALRVEKINKAEAPRRLAYGSKVMVHLLPLSGLAGKVGIDIAELLHKHDVLRIDPDHLWKRTTNLSGLLLFDVDEREGDPHYAQLFRNGTFEAVENVWYDPPPGNGTPWVIGARVGRFLRDAVSAYKRAASGLGLHGPCVLAVTVTGVGGTVLCYFQGNATVRPLQESQLNLPETMIEDISSDFDIDVVIKPIMDVLYQCYGRAKCDHFNSSARWQIL